MLAAFVLARFGLWDLASFALRHVVALSGLGVIAAIAATIALAIFVPGSVTLIRTALGVLMKWLTWLISTTAGAFVIVAFICLAAGWGARAFVDHSADIRRELAVQQQATAEERLRTVAAQAQAAAEHKQAVALNAVGDAASRRAEAAEAQSEDLQEKVTDYAAQLAAVAKAAPAKRCSRALTAADVAALARIGAPRAARR